MASGSGLEAEIARAAVKAVLGTSTNITYHNVLPDCKPVDHYVKWGSYEGNVVLHAFKCKMQGKTFQCFTIVYIEGFERGEGITYCYQVPQGFRGRLLRLVLESCPGESVLFVGGRS